MCGHENFEVANNSNFPKPNTNKIHHNCCNQRSGSICSKRTIFFSIKKTTNPTTTKYFCFRSTTFQPSLFRNEFRWVFRSLTRCRCHWRTVVCCFATKSPPKISKFQGRAHRIHKTYIWVFLKIGAQYPKMDGWKFHGKPEMNKWMIWRETPLFLETPIHLPITLE